MINSMSYKGYTASMIFDAEDKIIVGRVLDIDDIISFHGVSVAEFESRALHLQPPSSCFLDQHPPSW